MPRDSRASILAALANADGSFAGGSDPRGGGGIGDLAIRYGYYRFQTEVMETLYPTAAPPAAAPGTPERPPASAADRTAR